MRSARRYLLDTNVMSALVRDPHGPVAMRALAAGESRLCTSVVVACELCYGAARSGSPRLVAQLQRVLDVVPVLPLEPRADVHYAATRVELERKGTPIGQNDLLIAAHALAIGAVLVTANVREFARVPKLHVESWHRR